MAQVSYTDNGYGTMLASYLPTEVGEYKINIKFAEEHIPGSPFTAKITPGGISSRYLYRLPECSL